MYRILPIAPLALLFAAACDPLSPEERQQRLHLPKAGYKADATQGKIKFEQYCIGCHGPDAGGSAQGPPLVHTVYQPKRHANMAFHFAVRNGVVQHHWSFGSMPKIEGVTAEEVADITAYVRQLQRKAGIQ